MKTKRVTRPPEFLSAREAAELLRCSPEKVRAAVAAGALPGVRIGARTLRIPVAALGKTVRPPKLRASNYRNHRVKGPNGRFIGTPAA